MSQLIELLTEDTPDNELTPEYQANMFLIESAMRELGEAPKPAYQPSNYDTALTKLIDAVPRE